MRDYLKKKGTWRPMATKTKPGDKTKKQKRLDFLLLAAAALCLVGAYFSAIS